MTDSHFPKLQSLDELPTIEGVGSPDFYLVYGTETYLSTSGPDTYEGGLGNDTYDGGGGNDTIYGGGGNDTLRGGGDDDYIDGGIGDDSLESGIGHNTLIGGDGNDQLIAAGGNDLLIGGGGNDTISGGLGNDTLDGGLGENYLKGGRGDDTYYIRSVDDFISEFANIEDGYDTAFIFSDSFKLDDWIGIEVLQMGEGVTFGGKLIGNSASNRIIGGSNNDSLMGAGGDDTLSGGAGDDTLDGGKGVDLLGGGDGNDTYFVDAPSDIVNEVSGGGADTVITSINYSLAPTLENLIASSNAVGVSVLTGNNSANVIVGNKDQNKLYGGLGNDSLTGGAGQDVFVFNTKLNKKKNIDQITDFSVKDDSIYLENKVFSKLGKKGTLSKPAKLSKDAFYVGTKAADAEDRIIYNKKKGILYYDPDGAGSKSAIQFAVIKKNLKMAYKDFFVI